MAARSARGDLGLGKGILALSGRAPTRYSAEGRAEKNDLRTGEVRIDKGAVDARKK